MQAGRKHPGEIIPRRQEKPVRLLPDEGVLLQEEGRQEGAGEKKEGGGAVSFVRLLSLSFATSVDALRVGVGYSCLGRTSILGDVLLIGCTTFLISSAGCLAGRAGGRLAGGECQALGGIMLIAIGIKILVFG